MATSWLSTHGIGAIKDSKSSLLIVAEAGSAAVKPTSPSELTGWLHFIIDSPPVNTPTLKNLDVSFSSQGASVESVAVYLANDVIFEANNLQKTSSFQRKIISQESTYTGKGIAVSVRVQFENVSSKLNFQSVGIEV